MAACWCTALSPLLLGTAAAITLCAALAFVAALRQRKCVLRLPPGPKGLPILGSWFLFPGGAVTPNSLLKLSQQYGDLCLVKLGRCNVVIVSSPNMAKEVLQTRGCEFGSRSRNFALDVTSAHGQDMMFSDYGAHWHKMRRITAAPFFSTEAFRQYVPMWEEEIDAAIADIAILVGNSMASPPAVKIARFKLAVYNMVYRMTFNRRFENIDDASYVQISRLNKRIGVLVQSFRYNVAEFFPPLRIFFRSFIRELQELTEARLQMIEDVFIKQHSETPAAEKRRSGIDFLLDEEARGEISMKNLLLLFQNINVAGLSSIFTMIKWGIIELINHPKVQTKLHAELESTLGKGGCLKHKEIVNLPYLQALVKEVQRMHMPLPLLLPRLNEHQEKLGGYDIPPNSRILVNAWGIANHHRFWENPKDFCPERFMRENVDIFGNDYSILPFGSGRRGCPGSRMGFTILALTFGKMVQAFELLPPPGVEKVVGKEYIGQFASFINKLRVTLKPRDNTSMLTLPAPCVHNTM